MNSSPDPAVDLDAATAVHLHAQRQHALPRWYAVASTLAFVGGVGIVTIGAVAGWFFPVLGFLVLAANALTLPVLVATWRRRGVVPLAGRVTSSRYWRTAPALIGVAAILGITAIALGSAGTGGVWVWLALVVPFAVEHAVRMQAWIRR